MWTCTTSGRTSSSAARKRRPGGQRPDPVDTAAQRGRAGPDRPVVVRSPRAGGPRRRPRRASGPRRRRRDSRPTAPATSTGCGRRAPSSCGPRTHEWTARVSDLTLRSPEWSSDGSELGLPCGVDSLFPSRGCPVREHVGGRDTSMGYDDPGGRATAPCSRTRGASGGGSGLVERPSRSLRVLVHDFAGHPFQIDLSRALARRGHTVQHVYCGSYASGKGRFDAGDDANLSVVAVPAGESFARYSPLRRVSQEAGYGRRFTRVASAFRPDVILACNVPLVAKSVVASWCRRDGRAVGVLAAGPAQRRHGGRGREAGRSPGPAGGHDLRGARAAPAAPGRRRRLHHRRLPPGARRLGRRRGRTAR